MLAMLRKVKRKAVEVKKNIAIQKILYEIKRTKNLHGRTRLKLNLGSNCQTQKGFVNIDIDAKGLSQSTHDSFVECIAHDLSKGIPADNESTTYIYSSHFFEH